MPAAGTAVIRLRSIRTKLMAVVMSTTLAATLVSVGTVIGYDLRSYQHALKSDLVTQAELLGRMTAAALNFDDARLAQENLALLRARPLVRAGAIYNAAGKLVASYAAPGEPAEFPPRPEPGKPHTQGRYLVLAEPIVDNGDLLGTVYLRAENRLLQRILDYLLIAAGVTLLALATSWLVVRRIGRVITAPIVAITGIARDVVATRDYSRRAERISKDEAADLADSFNAMLGEIEQRTLALESSNQEIAHEAQERARAQQEVMRLNEELEERVHERTLQLELANQELVRAIEEARKANQAKSAFLSSMSHELRTPLNAILGFAQILNSDALPASDEQKREFADHIVKAGRHLLTLINEILDLAKIESGAVTLSMEPVGIDDVLAECRSMIDAQAHKRGIRVLFPDHTGAMVRADRTRLKQVLLNLLSNAVKYNREGGAVVLACAPDPSGRLRLSVQDTGMGLRQDQIDALFQPFNRLGQENGTQEGTGIGLVVTRRLVELMGGEIGVTSSPGVGSVFSIALASAAPATLGAPEPAWRPAASHDAAEGAAHLLLYVEDNPANLKLVEELVRLRADLRLLSAPDARMGIELARSHHPELILMDINLPGMSGVEALRVLRETPDTAGIPVIALTANAMPSDVERGIGAGFFRYLTKPIDIVMFNEAIDRTLEHVRARHAGEGAA
ncbi:ATP-binding protein [Massilia agilis]|uniref:histidine kinase n=1 Tax=Massilia agilis TaxID=1811226 RepID=A0ABT2DE89_9BURK|nr:ATP-binding protein [Massilia agilis]MCS0809640.1 ATP-binding protein [Massilia agilis]